ncbi:hypothetical protein FOA52_009662 [Chlamydomonas sp. UWO 241]|nr:hypothetical protein FOA52_009662 [Chlamydomonas sp. UWO 241]
MEDRPDPRLPSASPSVRRKVADILDSEGEEEDESYEEHFMDPMGPVHAGLQPSYAGGVSDWLQQHKGARGVQPEDGRAMLGPMDPLEQFDPTLPRHLDANGRHLDDHMGMRSEGPLYAGMHGGDEGMHGGGMHAMGGASIPEGDLFRPSGAQPRGESSAMFGPGPGHGGGSPSPVPKKGALKVKLNKVLPEPWDEPSGPLGGESSYKSGGGASGVSSKRSGASSKDKDANDPAHKYAIHVPDLDTGELEDTVMATVWRVGRHFGFQAFNVNPKTANMRSHEHVPSTIFVAADHLNQMLVGNFFIRRELGDDTPEERFAKAVHELHATHFMSYEAHWCTHVGLSNRTRKAQGVLSKECFSDPTVVNGLLSELALWFLLHTEASSLRHCPELLWFLFWCLNHSYVIQEAWALETPVPTPGLRNKYVELRNVHQSTITEMQNHLGLHPSRMRPEDCGRMSSIMARLKDSLVPAADCTWLADLVAFGDGGFFIDRIVTPIFYVMSYEIDLLSNLNIDVAHRLGYDDFNESMMDPGIVHDTLRALRVTPDAIARHRPNDAYSNLNGLGYERGRVAAFDPQVASDFWRTKVFVKTYRERRTWAAVYRNYYRVLAFHLVLFHLIQTFAFVGWDWRLLSSACLTMAWCKALERFTNFYMTREPKEPLSTMLSKVFSRQSRRRKDRRDAASVKSAMEEGTAHLDVRSAYAMAAERIMQRRHHSVEGAPMWNCVGFVEWVLLAVVMTGWYICMLVAGPLRDFAYEWWWIWATCYTGVYVLHFLLSTRCGYTVSLSHELHLPAIFKASSCVPDPVCWIYQPLRIKPHYFLLNALFWGIVLAIKIPFDYIIICKPIVEPLKLVFTRGWLGCGADDWWRGYWGAPCPGGDWILALARIFPFILIFFMDTSLFYQLVTTLYGVWIGMFKLDLGVLNSWDAVVQEFYKAPARWWHKCMSEDGNANQLALLKQSMFIVDAKAGGDGAGAYASAVVSDGLMFKKSMLTPEELKGKKNLQNGHRSAAQSRAQSRFVSRANSASGAPESSSGATAGMSRPGSAARSVAGKSVLGGQVHADELAPRIGRRGGPRKTVRLAVGGSAKVAERRSGLKSAMNSMVSVAAAAMRNRGRSQMGSPADEELKGEHSAVAAKEKAVAYAVKRKQMQSFMAPNSGVGGRASLMSQHTARPSDDDADSILKTDPHANEWLDEDEDLEGGSDDDDAVEGDKASTHSRAQSAARQRSASSRASSASRKSASRGFLAKLRSMASGIGAPSDDDTTMTGQYRRIAQKRLENQIAAQDAAKKRGSFRGLTTASARALAVEKAAATRSRVVRVGSDELGAAPAAADDSDAADSGADGAAAVAGPSAAASAASAASAARGGSGLTRGHMVSGEVPEDAIEAAARAASGERAMPKRSISIAPSRFARAASIARREQEDTGMDRSGSGHVAFEGAASISRDASSELGGVAGVDRPQRPAWAKLTKGDSADSSSRPGSRLGSANARGAMARAPSTSVNGLTSTPEGTDPSAEAGPPPIERPQWAELSRKSVGGTSSAEREPGGADHAGAAGADGAADVAGGGAKSLWQRLAGASNILSGARPQTAGGALTGMVPITMGNRRSSVGAGALMHREAAHKAIHTGTLTQHAETRRHVSMAPTGLDALSDGGAAGASIVTRAASIVSRAASTLMMGSGASNNGSPAGGTPLASRRGSQGAGSAMRAMDSGLSRSVLQRAFSAAFGGGGDDSAPGPSGRALGEADSDVSGSDDDSDNGGYGVEEMAGVMGVSLAAGMGVGGLVAAQHRQSPLAPAALSSPSNDLGHGHIGDLELPTDHAHAVDAARSLTAEVAELDALLALEHVDGENGPFGTGDGVRAFADDGVRAHAALGSDGQFHDSPGGALRIDLSEAERTFGLSGNGANESIGYDDGHSDDDGRYGDGEEREGAEHPLPGVPGGHDGALPGPSTRPRRVLAFEDDDSARDSAGNNGDGGSGALRVREAAAGGGRGVRFDATAEVEGAGGAPPAHARSGWGDIYGGGEGDKDGGDGGGRNGAGGANPAWGDVSGVAADDKSALSSASLGGLLTKLKSFVSGGANTAGDDSRPDATPGPIKAHHGQGGGSSSHHNPHMGLHAAHAAPSFLGRLFGLGSGHMGSAGHGNVGAHVSPTGGHDGGAGGRHDHVTTPFRPGSQKEWRKQQLQATIAKVDEAPVLPSMLLMGQDEDVTEQEIDDVHYQMMMWNSFASAWDDIIADLRQADIISDVEVSMLRFVRLDLGSRAHGLRPILLPTFFYAGQIRKVVDTGTVSTAQVMVLNELRMLCVWMGCQIGLLSGKHAHVLTSTPFIASIVNVKHALHRKKFYNAGIKMVELLEGMCQMQQVPFDMRDFADQIMVMMTGLESEAYAIIKANRHKRGDPGCHELELADILLEVVTELKREIQKDPGHLKVVFKNAIQNSATATFREMLRVVRVLKRMLLATVAEATPASEEAQRILGFFVNSLAHPNLDKPPSLDKMVSHTVLTPLYEEDVLYALEAGALAKDLGLKKRKLTDLLSESEESISLMSYLRSMFPNEWVNFKERMKTLVPDVVVDELSEVDFGPGQMLYEHRLELQMWASQRGQLLARTVNGMMRYEKAIRTLAQMELPKPPSMSESDHQKLIERIVQSKFEYLVTPQTYGKNAASTDVRHKWLAESMNVMLQRHPRLKAAFLDVAETSTGPTEYSVCIRGRNRSDYNRVNLPAHVMDDQGAVYETYRVRLPVNRFSTRGVILGEGKPENQNHACIFAFGEALQAIDMNQDNYLAEALKMRNLLSELNPKGYRKGYLLADDDDETQIAPNATSGALLELLHYRRARAQHTCLVGFREFIFSEASGALGRFAAATEYAFGTISQRVMTFPARVRLHYGHPDVFNKMWTMSRGGISKATRLLHLTEDVFSGCNHLLRGGRIRYKEYINCGKGRDMGFDSINGFNFKVSGGGGEWAISRESARMGTRLDWFRLMSFYHSAIGFYMNSWVTYMAVYFNIYALLLFAWAEATEIGPDGQRVYNVQQVLQFGTIALIPYIGQLMLEMGLLKTVLTLFQQICTGSLLFYMFQQMTVASSFYNDMMYGSGKYVGTGRGFNIQTMEFVKVFTLYARVHLYMGFELLFILTTLYIVRDCQSCNYGALTWSTWLLAFTLIMAPLWFNPFAFDMEKVQKNFVAWRQWMDGDIDFTTGTNWHTWNTMQLEKVRNDGGNNTDNWMNVVWAAISTLPYVLMALAAASRLDIRVNVVSSSSPLANGYIVFAISSAMMAATVVVTVALRQHWMDLADHKPWRIYRWLLTLVLVGFMFTFLLGVKKLYTGDGISTICIVLYANFMLLIAFWRFSTVAFGQNNALRGFCDSLYYGIDSVIGYLMFIIIALLAFLGVPSILQMRLLFNDSFAKSANYGKIAKAMKDAKIGGGYSNHAAPPLPSVSRPGSAQSDASRATFDVRSAVRSEHRYM